MPTPNETPAKFPTASKLALRPRKSWACDNFKVSEDDPNFCANCGDFASMHKGPTPGAIRTFRR